MNDSNAAAGKIWLRDYPPDVPAEIDPDSIPSLKHLFEDACRKHAASTAYANMGCKLRYADVDEQSRRFGAWLQKEAGLGKGDRVALMMPNILQYPIAIVGATAPAARSSTSTRSTPRASSSTSSSTRARR